jgi:hypothetical protein
MKMEVPKQQPMEIRYMSRQNLHQLFNRTSLEEKTQKDELNPTEVYLPRI